MARVRFPDDAYFILVSTCVLLAAAGRSATCYLTVAQLVERGTVNDTVVIPRSMVRIRPVRLTYWLDGRAV